VVNITPLADDKLAIRKKAIRTIWDEIKTARAKLQAARAKM
jgi:hypothetical protein